MKILALELSSARGSIALLDDNKLNFSREWRNDRKNSGPFFEHLAEVQKQFGKPDTIVVGLGPGSYAGTRIAISTAIGLSAGGTGRACPESVKWVPDNEKGGHGRRPFIRLIGYPSICAIEWDAPDYCVIGDARRNSFFYARIHDRNLAEQPTLMSEAELRHKLDNLDNKMPIFTTERLPQLDLAQLRYPAAAMLAQIATRAKRNFMNPPLEPMYLREPYITLPRR